MFEYVATIFYPFKATLNNSEFSMMVTLFPLPMVMAVYCIIKQKGKDILLDIMLGFSDSSSRDISLISVSKSCFLGPKNS